MSRSLHGRSKIRQPIRNGRTTGAALLRGRGAAGQPVARPLRILVEGERRS